MTDRFDLRRHAIAPRVADLGFSVELPGDWIAHDLPPADGDFSDPTLFVPLAVLTAPHAMIVFAAAARPAYDDGTLHDWTRYLIDASPMQPRAIGAGSAGDAPALVGEATQDSEVGEMIVRFAFLEDGGRIVHFSLSAPAQLDAVAAPLWLGALRSFALDRPRGATVPLFAPSDAPNADDEAPPTFADHALADSAASLDPEHPMNARLRESGSGFTPRLVATDDAARRASVAAGAIVATFDVPYGWHVMDDGRRALVFEPSGAIQINLDLVPRHGRDADAILGEIGAQALRDYPGAELLRLAAGQIEALGVRGIVIDGETLEQMHLLVPGDDDATALRARVTAPPERAGEATNLAELILGSVRFVDPTYLDGAPTPPPDAPADDDDGPSWWRRARALERAGRLEEAEEAITSSVPRIGASASVAQLYADRMARLAAAGDHEGAAAAYEKARGWIAFYAGSATSGGEGAALSQERDELLASLEASMRGRHDA